MKSRIVTNPGILSGKPCIRGTRISVELILALTSSGGTELEIAEAYPQLEPEDVVAAVQYAAGALSRETLTVIELEP